MEKSEVIKAVIFTLRLSVDIKFYIFTSENIKYTLYFINIFLYFSTLHCSDIDTKLAVCITESQEKLPTFYWLPKLHKRPYKARFIANSSSCTTTSVSKVLTSCLTAIKNHWIKYCEKTYEREGLNYFWSIKNSTEILDKLKTKGFQASTISTYDFSKLYTTLLYYVIILRLIRNQLVYLID